ncbi:PilW family protein [Aquabacterium sp.]|uniref:PilW family protein n=1 Tax=Aquabacterium sp. TaxID=1872578 RepID=UPI00199888F3|nr:PilW family protein [Aquabacterium sp.]MBC7699651.1 PilW family protein [Aquabacterium sp.]
MNQTSPHFIPRQRGISLIELMVAMAIGLVVIGAVFSTYLHSKAGSRQAAALSQVSEDASITLGILRAHVSMAGFSQPDANNGFDGFGINRRLKGAAIIGCDGGFKSGEYAMKPSAVTCKTIAAGAAINPPDSLIVRYEADERNGPLVSPTGGGTDAPADCVGTALVKGASPLDYWVSDSRFKIDTDSTDGKNLGLKCLGSGKHATIDVDFDAAAATTNFGGPGNGFQPLVNNIEDMQISYGVADTAQVVPVGGVTAVNRPGKRVVRYINASDVGDPITGDWDKVIAVRICLVVRSEDNVLDQATPYRGCSNAAAPTTVMTPTDRRIYRAFTTTVVLNNRI